MNIRLRELRALIREAFEDHSAWEKFSSPRSVIDLWHVTDAENLQSIYQSGLQPGYASMTDEGSPADAVYFFTDKLGADVLADKILMNGGAPAILHLRVPAKMLAKLDPRIDLEEEFGGNSIVFRPDKTFVKRHILDVQTSAVDLVPKQWLSRVV